MTTLLVVGPVAGLAMFVPLGWAAAPGLAVLLMMATMYVVTGLGIAAGFHRLFTHRSFRARRGLKMALAVAGSMALEGGVISWVAVHRRHHMFSDQAGDPHSPVRDDATPGGTARGFLWAHVGWLFADDPTDIKRFAPDLLKDRDLVVIDRLFPVLAVVSLLIPFGLGWAVSGTVAGAFAALLWAGLIRMAILHHVTWSINSACHVWGRRPFATKDRSGNIASLAVVSFGESWHNFHHAAPASARHGVLPHQIDVAAGFIRLLERFGWATKVRWPTSAQIAAVRRQDSVDPRDRAAGPRRGHRDRGQSDGRLSGGRPNALDDGRVT